MLEIRAQVQASNEATWVLPGAHREASHPQMLRHQQIVPPDLKVPRRYFRVKWKCVPELFLVSLRLIALLLKPCLVRMHL